jgi:hypothetical protein
MCTSDNETSSSCYIQTVGYATGTNSGQVELMEWSSKAGHIRKRLVTQEELPVSNTAFDDGRTNKPFHSRNVDDPGPSLLSSIGKIIGQSSNALLDKISQTASSFQQQTVNEQQRSEALSGFISRPEAFSGFVSRLRQSFSAEGRQKQTQVEANTSTATPGRGKGIKSD